MLEHTNLLIRELTTLMNYPEGMQRAITAIEKLQVDGERPVWCFYGHYINPIGTHLGERKRMASDFYHEMRKQYGIFPGGPTPVEIAVECMIRGKPLNEEEREFLALCKQVQAEVCSLQATGSEE